MQIEWQRLLSSERVPIGRSSSSGNDRQRPLITSQDFRSAFEADYDRVSFSTAFRRLARKTQVHPLAQNDQVHNRLTHSIEVAAVGRTLSRMLADLMRRRGEPIIDAPTTCDDLAWIMQAACLVHDIGNPPFGHAGEFAIREWVAEHADVVFPQSQSVSQGTQTDLRIFEGNAQGFRLAARTDNQQGYMRLTYATLGSMVKYPWVSTSPQAEEQGKFNCFSTEQSIFQGIWEQLGLIRDDGSYARHPLSFLSEAADDICYRIVDLEDAAEICQILNDDNAKMVAQFPKRFIALGALPMRSSE
ncbi:MAG: dGTP triphosphohydrolase, partial [Planctomycetota bacterium]